MSALVEPTRLMHQISPCQVPEADTVPSLTNAMNQVSRSVDEVVERLMAAERSGARSYLELRIDLLERHVHALGIEHGEVGDILRDIDRQLSRLWDALRELDATLVVTADHGNVAVAPGDLVELPAELVACCTEAPVVVGNTGRSVVFHCKGNELNQFATHWSRLAWLRKNFLLLTPESVADEGLMEMELLESPEAHRVFGSFVAFAVGNMAFKSTRRSHNWAATCCRSAHGSIHESEARVPLVLCTP